MYIIRYAREVRQIHCHDYMNLPNILTTIRLFLIPIFVLVFFSYGTQGLIYGAVIFLIAGFTDVLDGHLARKFNLVTKYGIVLDPLADKLMLLTVLFCLSFKQIIPFWIFIVIAVKDLSMIASGVFLYKKDTVIPSNFFGKASTVLFYVAILAEALGFHIGSYLLYIAVLSAFVALINYIIIFFKNKKQNLNQ